MKTAEEEAEWKRMRNSGQAKFGSSLDPGSRRRRDNPTKRKSKNGAMLLRQVAVGEEM